MTENYYPPLSPISTGVRGRCPRCGRGRLFDGYLTVAKSCASCGLDFSFADAGDGAVWFVMLFTCIVGVGSLLGIEAGYSPAWWVHMILAVPLLILMPMILLRPAKGILLCQQWKMNAQEGRLQK